MKIRSTIQGQSADTILTIATGILQACKDNANAGNLNAELAVLSSALETLNATLAHQRAVWRQNDAAGAAADAALNVICAAYETLAGRAEAQADMTPEMARRLGFQIEQPGSARDAAKHVAA